MTWSPDAWYLPVRRAFEQQTTLGAVTVSASGTCETSTRQWNIRLHDYPGFLSLLEVDSSGVENVISVDSWVNDEGGVWLGEIPAAYMTIPVEGADVARVAVVVNDESAVCDSDEACQYDFNATSTPTVGTAPYSCACPQSPHPCVENRCQPRAGTATRRR